MRPNSFLFFLITVLICFFIGQYGFIFYHEETHRAIYETYGIESKITYSIFGGATMPNITQYEKCDDNCKKTQDLTEIVGYHVQGFIFNLWILFFCFILFAIIILYFVLDFLVNFKKMQDDD